MNQDLLVSWSQHNQTDKEERRVINNHSLETLMISFMLIIQEMYLLELQRGKSHKKNVYI
ncbi:hypothetical protein IGI04_034625 [Brassica rapa subsp. trilocularis]|uniref:Uncharacterized protein n=1 Tax=Brassica rapa subsp. trilocularis TaxID=1813537 RepID=A0ABQ7LC51_BRACM|nr:hypothetical protein IGI04_034625 [Brassica rapa subsp. trilocularis]